MGIRSLASRLRRDRRGTALVETALVMPLILMLLFGIVEFGRALQQHHTLNKSLRDAARYLARVPMECPASADPNWASIRSTAQHLAATGRLSGGQPLVAGWSESDFVIADPVCETWAGRSVQVITVSADIAYRDLGLLPFLGLAPIRLGGAHQQVHIGE